MQNVHNLIQEKDTLLLKGISHLNVVAQLDSTENDVSSVARNHDLELPITLRNCVTDNPGAKLSEAHLEQFSNSINCLLQLHRLDLSLGFEIDLFVCENRLLGLLQGVIGQLLDDPDHLGDRLNDHLLCVCREHQRASRHHDAGEDRRDKLVLGVLDLLFADVEPGVGHQLAAVLDCSVCAPSRLETNQLHLVVTEVAWLVRDTESRAEWVLLPVDLLRIETVWHLVDGVDLAALAEVGDVEPEQFLIQVAAL